MGFQEGDGRITGAVLQCLPPRLVPCLDGGLIQQAGPPQLIFKMGLGVLLLQKMAPRAHRLDYFPRQGLAVDGNAADEALGHANDFISHNQLFEAADHAGGHVTDIVNEVEAPHPLAQNRKGRLQPCLGV